MRVRARALAGLAFVQMKQKDLIAVVAAVAEELALLFGRMRESGVRW